VLQPGNVWVIEKAVPDNLETDADLKTCYMRGWVEPLENSVPKGRLKPDKPCQTSCSSLMGPFGSLRIVDGIQYIAHMNGHLSGFSFESLGCFWRQASNMMFKSLPLVARTAKVVRLTWC
jgi:hypothetical protein